MTLHIQTPLMESRVLSKLSGISVWLKNEAVQPSGSFKIRGIGVACEEYLRRGATRFISSSGGNAGIAVAYAGRRLSVPVTVVVPETTSQKAIELIRQEEAEVIINGPSWQEANALALSMKKSTDAFIHPFDDPLLWQGHGTIIDEIVQAGIIPDAIVVSVGGGGLMCGIIDGLKRNNLPNVKVIAVETEGAASLNRSVEEKRLIELQSINSIATSLGAKKVCEQAFSLTCEHTVQSVLVSDRSAVSACSKFLNDHRILVEPACGAALSLVYETNEIIKSFKSIFVIVCGGATTSSQQLQKWSKLYS